MDMPEAILAVEGGSGLMKELCALAEQHGIETSKPVSKTSPADALDSPIGGEEIRQALELATLVFKSGAAAVAFFTALKPFLQKHPTESLVVKDPLSGSKKGRIDQTTSTAEVQTIVEG
ncbi:MAG TPA: hypothetical protein VGW57_01575 [Chthoniobacterales bacterium]|nr:hypothetical protein [Chthoniobacterales bacterium]